MAPRARAPRHGPVAPHGSTTRFERAPHARVGSARRADLATATHAGAPFFWFLCVAVKKVRAEASKIGIPVDNREFHCKGEFKGVHKGKPDDNDLKNIAEFAKGIAEEG